jgi:hypothetical protein
MKALVARHEEDTAGTAYRLLVQHEGGLYSIDWWTSDQARDEGLDPEYVRGLMEEYMDAEMNDADHMATIKNDRAELLTERIKAHLENGWELR